MRDVVDSPARLVVIDRPAAAVVLNDVARLRGVLLDAAGSKYARSVVRVGDRLLDEDRVGHAEFKFGRGGTRVLDAEGHERCGPRKIRDVLRRRDADRAAIVVDVRPQRFLVFVKLVEVLELVLGDLDQLHDIG